MIKQFKVPEATNTLKQLHLSAHSYIKFSNNVSALDVVSTLQSYSQPGLNAESTIDKQQITKFSVGSNVKALLPSCFIDCTNLVDVSFRGELNIIDNYAFYNCTSLKNLNVLNTNHIADSIGDYAFAKTGIETAKFGVKNTTSYAQFLGEGIFASCYSLGSFEFSGKNTIGPYMFQNCINLSSVKFVTATDVISPGAFQGCVSLKRLQLPADTYTIPDNFAMGCKSIASFTITEPGNLVYDQCIGNGILADTELTSLTFPSSVSSFNVFSQNTLHGMGALAEIHFNGMTYEQLASATSVEVQVDPSPSPSPTPPTPSPTPTTTTTTSYDTTKIYYEDTLDSMMTANGITAADKSAFFIRKSVLELCQMVKNCLNNSIPVAVFISSSDTHCSHCNDFASRIVVGTDFKSFLQSNSSCVVIYGSSISKTSYQYIDGNTRISNFWELAGFGSTLGYVGLALLQKSTDGSIRKQRYQDIPARQGAPLIVQYLTSFSSASMSMSYEEGDEYGTVVVVTSPNRTITGTNCFGLNHNVKLYSKDGKCIEFFANGAGGTAMYNTTVQVDKLTVNDFRYGQWYAQSKLLKSYADANYIPVLAVATQGNGYQASQVFNNNVFNNDSFQQHMTSKKILLCKIDSSSFSTGNPAFLLRTWMKKSSFGKLPLFMMYWKSYNTAINIETGLSSDDVDSDFAYFSNVQTDTAIDDVRCVHSAEDIISWIESLDTYKRYISDPKFDRPQIQSFLTRYPKYKRYDNQPDDDYGRYYPVDQLGPQITYSYTVNVNNASGTPIDYSMYPTAQAANLPPVGTYQYFTLIKTEDNASTYEASYQALGMLFKVGSEETVSTRSQSFSYGNKTYSAYLSELGLTAAKIQSSQFDFNDEMYLDDENGYPTTTIDPDYFDTGETCWNDFCSILLKPSVYIGSKIARSVKIWLSSQAQIKTETDEDGDSYSYVAPGNVEYVISAQINEVTYGANKLLWSRPFTNNP